MFSHSTLTLFDEISLALVSVSAVLIFTYHTIYEPDYKRSIDFNQVSQSDYITMHETDAIDYVQTVIVDQDDYQELDLFKILSNFDK